MYFISLIFIGLLYSMCCAVVVYMLYLPLFTIILLPPFHILIFLFTTVVFLQSLVLCNLIFQVKMNIFVSPDCPDRKHREFCGSGFRLLCPHCRSSFLCTVFLGSLFHFVSCVHECFSCMYVCTTHLPGAGVTVVGCSEGAGG